MKKLIVTTSSLKDAMKTVKKVVDKKSVLPILEYFKCLVTVKGGRAMLTVIGTDLESYISATVNCEAKEEFIFLLHSEELKLIEKLDEQPITISVDPVTFCAKIITETETVSVVSDDFNDFPKLPSGTMKPIGRLTDEFFAEIKTSLSYCSKDSIRIKFTGIHFKITEGKLKLCATDAHLLRTTTLNGEINQEAEEEAFIMNPTFCKLISAIKDADDVNVSIMKKDTSTLTVLTYTQGRYMSVEIISRNIDDKYCDYQSVIPSNHSTEVTLDKKDLIKRIDKAMLYCNKTTMQGNFSFNGRVILTAADQDFAKEYKTEFATNSKTGSDIEIGFNLSLLKKVLSDVKGEAVSMEFNNPNTAAVIKENNSLTLIMPCLI